MILMLFALMTDISNAQRGDSIHVKPRYTMGVVNQNLVSPNTLIFDIYILHTNFDSTTFQLAGAQYFFKYFPGVANGGTLSYTFAPSAAGDSSDLPFNMRPRNPSFDLNQNLMRLAANSLPGAGNGFFISHTGLGSKIIRMRLSTTAASLNMDSIGFTWHNALPNPFTKVNAYTGLNGTFNTDITTPSTHYIDGLVGVTPNEPSTIIPSVFSLSQNYPNPFNPTTSIQYALPQEGRVNIKIFDLTGREIMNLVNNEVKAAGTYDVKFNGSNFASGVYFYRIEVFGEKKYESTKRMVLIK